MHRRHRSARLPQNLRCPPDAVVDDVSVSRLALQMLFSFKTACEHNLVIIILQYIINMSVSGISGVIPPVGSHTKHVQSKEKTLANDVYRHARLAKKEMKVANKLESKAQKVSAKIKSKNLHCTH